MKKIIVILLFLINISSFGQFSSLDQVINKEFAIYQEYNGSHIMNTYSCVIDSSTIGYSIAFHTHLVRNSIFVSGCKNYYIFNDSIIIFIRTNSLRLHNYYPKATKQFLEQTNSKYNKVPLIVGERKVLVITTDKNFVIKSNKWYEYNEHLPAHLWDISNELIKKWNDSLQLIEESDRE
jgi:hypothetical protein